MENKNMLLYLNFDVLQAAEKLRNLPDKHYKL